jgi:hypothetical protein
VPVDEHFRAHQSLYLGKRQTIAKLDVLPVMEDHGRVVDYVFKTVLRGRVSYDEGVVILPRTRTELPERVYASVHRGADSFTRCKIERGLGHVDEDFRVKGAWERP